MPGMTPSIEWRRAAHRRCCHRNTQSRDARGQPASARNHGHLLTCCRYSLRVTGPIPGEPLTRDRARLGSLRCRASRLHAWIAASRGRTREAAGTRERSGRAEIVRSMTAEPSSRWSPPLHPSHLHASDTSPGSHRGDTLAFFAQRRRTSGLTVVVRCQPSPRIPQHAGEYPCVAIEPSVCETDHTA